jgi:hypothetical protein
MILKTMKNHYHVYAIQLSHKVLEERKFMKSNPNYILGMPCFYIGMTGLDPDIRFDKHKAGIQSSKYVEKYGIKLVPELYVKYNPMSYEDAKYFEVDMGIRLRNMGYGVWQA